MGNRRKSEPFHIALCSYFSKAICNLSVEEFQSFLNPLSLYQQVLCKDVRKKFKNKESAQKSRIKKLKELQDLKAKLNSKREELERLRMLNYRLEQDYKTCMIIINQKEHEVAYEEIEYDESSSFSFPVLLVPVDVLKFLMTIES